MRLLVIGGTVFVGRSVVEAALERGDDVTLFNRGIHNPKLFPDVPKLRGDRRSDLSSLRSTRWDVVVDTCAFVPEDVTGVVEAIGGAVERYVFVSSASVYRDWPAEAGDESLALVADPDTENTYGLGKARCESAFESALPGRVIHARAGVIVGPHENVGRLPYWLGRAATGKVFVAPGNRRRPTQVVDARDLAAWVLEAAEAGARGPFNLAGIPRKHSFGELIETCVAVTGRGARPTWIPDGVLLSHGVEPWSELPLWLPDVPANSAAFDLDVDRAVRNGFEPRPLSDTIADTWRWMNDDGPIDERSGALTRSKEEAILDAAL